MMARVPPVRRELVPPHLQAAFDSAAQALPKGMQSVLLYSPEASVRAHHWADYLRNDSSCLPAYLRQLAMLVVARERDCQYIWNAHADMARKAGLSAELVEALRDKKTLPEIKADEAATIKYGQEYYRTSRVSQETFSEALHCLGTQGLAELTMLMGFYAMLAFTAAAFDIEVPAGHTEPLLPV